MPRRRQNNRNKELSPAERAYICGLRDGGMRPAEISRKVNKPLSTITTTLYKAPLRHNQESMPRSGRPQKASERDKRHILMTVKRDPRITWRELLKHSSIRRTQVYQMLKSFNIKNRIARGRPLLSKEQARERLLWARRHRHWSWRRWAKVIWSDEYTVERGKGHQRLWVFRTP